MGRKIKNKNKKAGKYIVNRKKTKDQIEKEEEESSLNKYYWYRTLSCGLVGFIGRAFFGLIGWWALLWMSIFLFVYPFLLSFLILKIPYDKDNWSWKDILKNGLFGGFTTYMLIATVTHTFMVAGNYPASIWTL